MTRFVLTRHGETVWHAENPYAGHTDIDLTERGREQAIELAAWAKQQSFNAVWSSPLTRARLTAQPTANALSTEIKIDARLIEVDFGAAKGLTDHKLRESFPSQREAFVHDPLSNPLPSSEPIRVAAERGEAALRHIASLSPDSRVLVVAHNTLLRLVLCHMLGVSLGRYRSLSPNSTTLRSPKLLLVQLAKLLCCPSTSPCHHLPPHSGVRTTMSKEKLLLIGDHFILPSVMREALGPLADRFDIREAQTPFPLEPFRNIAEVREASGSEEMMIQELEGVSLCIAHHAPLTRKIIEASPALRLFIVCRGGPVNVNLDAASEHGISVAYTPARNAAATAEHTIAMMMCAMRNIATRNAALHQG